MYSARYGQDLNQGRQNNQKSAECFAGVVDYSQQNGLTEAGCEKDNKAPDH